MFNIHNKHFLMVVKPHRDDDDMQIEMHLLEQLLVKATRIDDIATCSEIADLNRYKLISQREKVKRTLLNRNQEKPFVFQIFKN